MTTRPCSCGSGLQKRELLDARGKEYHARAESDLMQGISYPVPAEADMVIVPMWALDCILLRADFYDAGEDETSDKLQAALDVVQAVMQDARLNLAKDAEVDAMLENAGVPCATSE